MSFARAGQQGGRSGQSKKRRKGLIDNALSACVRGQNPPEPKQLPRGAHGRRNTHFRIRSGDCLRGRRGEGTGHYTLEGRAPALLVVLRRIRKRSAPMRVQVLPALDLPAWPSSDRRDLSSVE